MPARQLPRTDDERTAALSTCTAKATATPPAEWLITSAQNAALNGILSPWRAKRDALGPALQAQTDATAVVVPAMNKSEKFNSHFIQVINLAIDRGDLPASVRSFYQLPVSHAQVPQMNTCPLAVLWAANLSNGETARVAAGGAPMAWPTIAQVNAAAAACAAAENIQSAAKDAYDDAQEAVANDRPAVDAAIKDAWDTIEFNLRADAPPSLRRKAREWGVVYIGEEEAPAPPAPPAPPTP